MSLRLVNAHLKLKIKDLVCQMDFSQSRSYLNSSNVAYMGKIQKSVAAALKGASKAGRSMIPDLITRCLGHFVDLSTEKRC